MQSGSFVFTLALMLAPLFIWSFKVLPQERWQIICAIPIKKMSNGTWQGLNLTYYGLFNALGLSAAVGLVLILTAAAGINLGVLSAIIVALLAICLPASRWVARWVEKKPNTFSIGAASFLGILLGPWMILFVASTVNHRLGIRIEPMAVLTALVIGYALGEGIGRLACISFGCCYGKPMHQMPKMIQRYFSWAAFTFRGCTKKIVYAHRLEGEKVFAVQAVTAFLYSTIALAGTYLFLHGRYGWAFLLCLAFTQGWRFISEFLRADYRGDRKISAYQIMSLLTIPYACLILFLFPASGSGTNVLNGLRVFWNPAIILFLQILWLIMFLRTGRSQTTGSDLSFHVHQDRI